MKHDVECVCGYVTPAVEDEEDIDMDLLYAHQEFCQLYGHRGPWKEEE